MPTYFPLQIKGFRYGLNERVRETELAPGEAVIANDVEFRNYSISKRRGHEVVYDGAKDSVILGTASAGSLYVEGDQPWMEHPENQTGGSSHRDAYLHHRQGLIIIAEDNEEGLQLPVGSAEFNWAFDINLWTDEMPNRLNNPGDGQFGTMMPSVVMAKSNGLLTQWAVRIIPEAGNTRLKVVLTLYDAGAHAAGTDYFFDDGGGNKSWFEIGTRIWVAWEHVPTGSTNGQIKSYYWKEGDTSIVTSTTNVDDPFTNDTNPYALTIGRRPFLIRAAGPPNLISETGFNGSVPEMRLWWDGTATAVIPDFVSEGPTSYPVEREFTDTEIDPDGTPSTPTNWLDNDLALYYSFDPRRVNQNFVDARTIQAQKGDLRWLQPRFTRTGQSVAENVAWLTGADATWVPGGGSKLGEQALAFCPAGAVNGQDDAHQLAIFAGQAVDEAGGKAFGCGIRIPNTSRYVQRETTPADPADVKLEFPDKLSIRVAFKLDGIPTNSGGTQVTGEQMTLIEMSRVEQGSPAEDYTTETVWALRVVWDGVSAWVVRFAFRDVSLQILVDSTTTLVEGTEYVALATLQFSDGSGSGYTANLYLDGVQQGAATSGATARTPMSENTNSDQTGGQANRNDEDGRDRVHMMTMGFGARTAVTLTDDYDVRHGAPQQLEGINSAGGRRDWGIHNNETLYSENDGLVGRHRHLLIGLIGSVQIWHRILTESEVRRFVDRPPNEQEIAAYGAQLLSSWNMEEGVGSRIQDDGHLGNHLVLHEYPRVLPVAGACYRVERPAVTGLWEVRTRTPREGIRGRDIYVLGEGTLSKEVTDGSGDKYLTPVAGRILQRQLYAPIGFGGPSQQQVLTASAFQFSDFFYLCTGKGPVLRVSRGKVTPAGISPVFGEPGQQQDSMGWAEPDRDGTFQVFDASFRTSYEVANPGTFIPGEVYKYLVTFYDPESGVESAPSRQYVHEVQAGVTLPDSTSLELSQLPRPRQRNVTRYRIYRTTAGGGVFKRVDEIPLSVNYVDDTPDNKLGVQFGGLRHLPPPQNCLLGVAFGSRAIYAGVEQAPGTVFYSLAGFPEIVPTNYQLTVSSGRSGEITALLPLHDRVLVFLRDAVFSLTDQGGDLSLNSEGTPPMIASQIQEGVGCLSHHSLVTIPGIGTVFAGERGPYLTDGNAFHYIGMRVESTWRGIHPSAFAQIRVVHNRKSEQVLWFIRCSSGSGRNDCALVWDYGRNAGDDPKNIGAWSIYRGLEFAVAQQIEDESSDTNLLYLGGYAGEIEEFDAPNNPSDTDGANGAATVAGTVIAATADAYYESPTGGKEYWTKLQLVDATAVPADALPTAGAGLRGAMLRLIVGATTIDNLQVLWNDTENVIVSIRNMPEFAAVVTAPWQLGAIRGQWRTGSPSFGKDSILKKINWTETKFEASTGTTLTHNVTLGDQTAQAFTLDPTTARDRSGAVNGRGGSVQLEYTDDVGDNHWEVKEVELAYRERGRSKW